MSKSEISMVADRAVKLYESLMLDPDRPFWQVEMCSILVSLGEIITLLSSDLAASNVDAGGVSRSLASLEARYSELLYRMSEK